MSLRMYIDDYRYFFLEDFGFWKYIYSGGCVSSIFIAIKFIS